MKTLLVILCVIGVMFAALRIGNALLIYDHATIIVKPALCGPLVGEMKDSLCVVKADLSHELISGDPIVRLMSGQIIHLNADDVLSYSVASSRYSFSW